MKQEEGLIPDYLEHCKYCKNLDDKTIKAYGIDLRQFEVFTEHKYLDLNREDLNRYVVFLQQMYSVKTVKRKIASVKAFFNYLQYCEAIESNPWSQIRIKLHEPSRLPRTIPFKSIESLLCCAYHQKSVLQKDTYAWKCTVRDIAVLEVMFATGMRVSELCNLKSESVNLEDGTIKIFGKGAKERIIQISNCQVMIAIVNYYSEFKDKMLGAESFFVNRLGKRLSDQSVRFMINKYVKLTEITMHITPHMFRHSFATLLLEEDVDIRYIQQFLGHSSIVTTQIYTHVASKKQRDILSAKHPRNKMKI